MNVITVLSPSHLSFFLMLVLSVVIAGCTQDKTADLIVAAGSDDGLHRFVVIDP